MGVFDLEEPLTIGQRGALLFYPIEAGSGDVISNMWRADFRNALRGAQLPLSSLTIKRLVDKVYGCREVYKVSSIEMAHAKGPWLLSTISNAAMRCIPEHDIYFLRITCDTIRSQIQIHHAFIYVGEALIHDCPDIIYKEISYDRCKHMAKPAGRWIEATGKDALEALNIDSKEAVISKFVKYYRDKI